jgi:hypothetical protein
MLETCPVRDECPLGHPLKRSTPKRNVIEDDSTNRMDSSLGSVTIQQIFRSSKTKVEDVENFKGYTGLSRLSTEELSTEELISIQKDIRAALDHKKRNDSKEFDFLSKKEEVSVNSKGNNRTLSPASTKDFGKKNHTQNSMEAYKSNEHDQSITLDTNLKWNESNDTSVMNTKDRNDGKFRDSKSRASIESFRVTRLRRFSNAVGDFI